MGKEPKAAIVILCRGINDYLREAVSRVLELDYSELKVRYIESPIHYENFEILVLSDGETKEVFPKTKIIPTGKVGPAEKRNLALKYTDAEILAFLDDDSYPEKNWLKNAVDILEDAKIAAVCGPTLTPPNDSLKQKVSGYVWSSWLGAGGAGTYRSKISPRREVDDFPSVNLIVKREDFEAVHGFDSRFWPGEDSKLCLDLTRKLGKKIIYDPGILVYHHRRPVFGPHLTQIAGYGLHRGYFARVFPETSKRIGYFMPSLFVLGLFSGPILIFLLELFRFYGLAFLVLFSYLASLVSYFFLLFLTVVKIFFEEKNFQFALLLIPAIFLTHLFYGFWFLRGFFSRELKN